MLQKGSKGCTQKILGMWLRTLLLPTTARMPTNRLGVSRPSNTASLHTKEVRKKTTLLHKHVLSSGTTGQILTRPFAVY